VSAARIVPDLSYEQAFDLAGFCPRSARRASWLPLALPPLRAVRAGARGPALIGALGQTGRLQLAFGLLLTVGLAVTI